MMGIHIFICSLLLQRMLNVGPYQTMIFAPAPASDPAYEKGAQSLQCRPTGVFFANNGNNQIFYCYLYIHSDHQVTCMFYVPGLVLYVVV